MKKYIAWLNILMILLSCASTGILMPVQKAYAAEADRQDIEVNREAAENTLQAILEEHDVMALVYPDATQSLWSEPSFDSEELEQLPTGQTVFVRDVLTDEEALEWVYIETYFKGQACFGYIPRLFLACSDEDFLQWESVYMAGSNSDSMLYGLERNFADIEAFPESYREALYALRKQHPNWIFVRMDTGLSWSNAVAMEMKGDRSLIYKTYPDYVRKECYDDGNWYYPTEDILKYYMDPRNGLTEEGIFQFELLTYNKTYHTEAAVDLFLNSTFMNNKQNAPGTTMSFAHIFWEVGSEQNVSPFHLAARVYQEQGTGNSALISGTYPGYEGYYNYFNIKASGTSKKEIIENGLNYAKSQGWNTAYAAIYGGTKTITAYYISKGQDTLYLQKYNVNTQSPYGVYNHQYMQNIAAPSGEGKKVKTMYQGANSLDNTFVFKIPVYGNMPETACSMPTGPADENIAGEWREENGYYYWYENGVRQGTEGRGKEIYDAGTDAWYWLDGEFGGRKAVDKDVYMESYAGAYADREDGTGKWVRYDENGRMVKGEDFRYGDWYRFDEETGAMVKDWYTTETGAKYYYDKSTGKMAHGYKTVDGQNLYFDSVTGVLVDYAWTTIDGGEYWFEGGIKQGTEGRGKEIYDPGTDAWYWLDSVDGGKKAVSKDVYQESYAGEYADREDGTGKWVRYDVDGHMVKGWNTNEIGTYYFDLITGAMAKGEAVIDGNIYNFDVITGILQ